jgi:enterochelin esterase-like enzyme
MITLPVRMKILPFFLSVLFALVLLTSCLAETSPGASTTAVLETPSPFLPQVSPTTTIELASAVEAASDDPVAAETRPPQATETAFQPSPSPTALICGERQGRVERHELVVKEGNPALGFRVYLPPCFDNLNNARYPVLYMIHGQSFNDDQWVRLGIAEAADELIVQKRSPPFMIVMPHEKNTYADIFTTPFPGSVVDGLVPWIDETYPTCAHRTCRAIGGLSRGGAWALHLGFTRWDLFGAVGLHSTPPFIGDPDRFPRWIKEIPTDEIPRIYMDTGRHDYYIAPTVEFEALLVQLQVPHEWYLFKGTHEEAYWAAHIGDYLRWYTQPWQDMRDELTGP